MTLRLVEVRARNLMGLTDATLAIGNGTEVHGENEGGKTSIAEMLKGIATKGGRHLITNGAAGGEILARLEGGGRSLEIKRKLGGGVKVTDTSGPHRTSVEKPQAFLEELFQLKTIDPLAFAEMDAKAQLGLLLEAFPTTLHGEEAESLAGCYGADLDGDGFAAHSRLLKLAEQARTSIGQTLKKAKGAADSAKPESTEDTYDEEAHETARARHRRALDEMAALGGRNEAITARNERIEYINQQISQLNIHLDSLRRDLETVGPIQEVLNDDAATDTVQRAMDEFNKHVHAYRDHEAIEHWKEMESLHDIAHASYMAAGADIDTIRTTLCQSILNQIDCPVDGLEITDELKVKGKTMDQLSRTAKTELGVKIAAALQKNAEVRFVVVDNAESITKSRRVELAGFCEAAGLQWVFLVANDVEDMPAGVARIEDGVISQEKLGRTVTTDAGKSPA